MRKGKKRTMLVCLTDLPKDRIVKAGNGKKYISLTAWDYNETDTNDNDFSIRVSPSPEQNINGIPGTYVGNGKIWEV